MKKTKKQEKLLKDFDLIKKRFVNNPYQRLTLNLSYYTRPTKINNETPGTDKNKQSSIATNDSIIELPAARYPSTGKPRPVYKIFDKVHTEEREKKIHAIFELSKQEADFPSLKIMNESVQKDLHAVQKSTQSSKPKSQTEGNQALYYEVKENNESKDGKPRTRDLTPSKKNNFRDSRLRQYTKYNPNYNIINYVNIQAKHISELKNTDKMINQIGQSAIPQKSQDEINSSTSLLTSKILDKSGKRSYSPAPTTVSKDVQISPYRRHTEATEAIPKRLMNELYIDKQMIIKRYERIILQTGIELESKIEKSLSQDKIPSRPQTELTPLKTFNGDYVKLNKYYK